MSRFTFSRLFIFFRLAILLFISRSSLDFFFWFLRFLPVHHLLIVFLHLNDFLLVNSIFIFLRTTLVGCYQHHLSDILSRERLFLEPNNNFIILLEILIKLMSQVNQEVRVDISTFKVFTVPVYVVPIQVLIIEQHNHLIVCVANYCPSDTKWNEFSLRRVDVHDAVANSIVIAMLKGEGLAPIREVLLVEHVWLQELKLLAI